MKKILFISFVILSLKGFSQIAQPIIQFPTLDSLMNYTGTYHRAFVTDSINGGVYYKSSSGWLPVVSKLLTVKSLCELQTANVANRFVVVSDPYEGGIFFHKPASENLTTDGILIIDAIDGGYWVRDYDKSAGVNAFWAGIKPGTGVDYTTQFTTLFNAAVANSVKKIFIPKGYYYANLEINNSLYINSDSAIIDGTLTDSGSTINITSSNVYISNLTILFKSENGITVNNGSNIILENLVINATDTATGISNYAIRVSPYKQNLYITNVNIQNVVINTHSNGINISAATSLRSVSNVIADNVVINQIIPYNNSGAGVGFIISQETNNVTVRNSNFSIDTGYASIMSITNGASGARVMNNNFYCHAVGIAFSPGGTNAGVRDCIISGNNFFGDTAAQIIDVYQDGSDYDTVLPYNSAIAISFTGGASIPMSAKITGNKFYYLGSAIDGYMNNGEFSNNSVSHCDGYISHFTGGDNLSITNNSFIGNDNVTQSLIFFDGISRANINNNYFRKVGIKFNNGSNNYFTNNTLDSVRGTGSDTSFDAPIYLYGASNPHNYYILNNTVIGDTLQRIVSINSVSYSKVFFKNNVGGRIYVKAGNSEIYSQADSAMNESYTGTDPTFTATTAPSGNFKCFYSWWKNNSRVDFLMLGYWATAGSAVTQITLDLPVDCPIPTNPLNLTSAGNVVWSGWAKVFNGASNVSTTTSTAAIIVNPTATGYQLVIATGSISAKFFHVQIQYNTNSY